jgi:hypothetical protein
MKNKAGKNYAKIGGLTLTFRILQLHFNNYFPPFFTPAL